MLGSLALRDLTLVESLLQLVERLESTEENPQQLASLFRIDHLATRMRRNGENLLVLAGYDNRDDEFEPMSLLDVARAAISEITHYNRAQVTPLPDVHVIGLAADDLSHILAELLDNATSKSPENAPVTVRGDRTGDGTLVISVEDSGIGIPADRLAEINTRLSHPPVLDAAVTRHMGLYVVGKLAHRHDIRVQLRERPYGGIVASVIIPARLVLSEPRARPEPSGDDGVGWPGSPSTVPGRLPATRQTGRALTFQPGDPAELPRRTPGALPAAGDLPVRAPSRFGQMPEESGLPQPDAVVPAPAASAPGVPAPAASAPDAPPIPSADTESGPADGSQAEQIRAELSEFQLGRRAARRHFSASADKEQPETASETTQAMQPAAHVPLEEAGEHESVEP